MKSSIVWDLTGSLSRQVITFTTSLVLARILEPSEFGIIGIALVFIALSDVIMDAGFTETILQKKRLSQSVYSSIFLVNIIVSLLFSSLIYFISGYVASFYKIVDLDNVLKLLAILLPIGALGKVQNALLAKDMMFKKIASINVTASLLSGTIGVVLAFKGLGVFSLVYQQITFVSVSSFLLWILNSWRPRFEFSYSGLKELVPFSFYVFSDKFTHQLFLKLDTLFIGKVFSPTELGFYSRAQSLNSQLSTFTSTSFNKVLFSHLNQLKNSGQDIIVPYMRAYKGLLIIISCVSGFLYFLSTDLIILLYGVKWEFAGQLFKILVLKTLITPLAVLQGNFLLTLGHAKLKFKLTVIHRFLLLIPIAIGMRFSIVTFTWLLISSILLAFILNTIVISRKSSISFGTQIRSALIINIPLIILGIVDGLQFIDLNGKVFGLIFILSQTLFILRFQKASVGFIRMLLKI
ncbi:MAG: lipopolysaccharide biosynthesis protein [Bacteroidia bacterium]